MKFVLILIGITACASFASADVKIKCSAQVVGESGNGQKFVFSDVLIAAFTSIKTGELRFESNGDLEDAGSIMIRGPARAHNNYSYYSGRDRITSGTVALSLPNDILMKQSGTKFKCYFDTFERNFGTTRPVKILDDLEMNCLIQ